MKTDTVADVIVVGLGAFGSATAYQLAKRGVRVLGIDQFTPPHDRGSSHGATRITRMAVGEGEVYVPIIKRSHAIWDELERDTGATLFHRTGGLIMGLSGETSHHGRTDFIKRSIDTAVQFGIPHEVLDAAEVRRRYPQFQTQDDEIAYFEPGAGALVPESCVQVQLDEARRLGADLRYGEKVLSITEQGDSVTVRTTSGDYSAAKVIVTAGPWVPGMAGGVVQANLRVMRQTLHWFATDAPQWYAPERCPVFIWMHGRGDDEYLYGFPMVDGKPGVKVASEQYFAETLPDQFARAVETEESEEMYDRHVKNRLRALQRQAVHAAACLYTVSTDSHFIVDRYRDMRNVQVVSACSGHGFKNSAGLGEQLALAAIEGVTDAGRAETLAAFSVSRFC
ncbi:N-methyl-L-tryptophan oxidase [Robbsia sp. KACC 23696]|uniref:N-methyl-L-tryptophan oxidase n=1 Tax=Robbsia sp. KACC 23696 TaxID=3149231 RepID=UPI00325ACC4F